MQVQQLPAEQLQARQPPQGAGGWGLFKTLLVRMVIIYLISSLFKRGQQPAQTEPGTAGAPAQSIIPAANLFPKDTVMVLDELI